MKIGLMNEPFPVVLNTEMDSETFQLKCKNFIVDVTVSQCKLQCGEFTFTGVITSRVDIADKLPLHGFAFCCFIDEGETMLEAVKLYAEKRNKKIGGTYNNWPSFRGFLADKT